MGPGNSQKIKGALVDLSGTLHIGDEAVAGAAAALKKLRKLDVCIRFITNTTKEPKRVLWERLTSLGFEISKDEIFTALTAARQMVDKKGLRPYFLLEDSALEDFQGIPTEQPNAVVVGLAPSRFNYSDMNEAFRLVLDGAPLIAVHKGRYYATESGHALGPGAFVAALEHATQSQAAVIGKPSETFFRSVLENISCRPEEAVMIGDDVLDDVKGAQAVGMTGLLVRTGKYREGDEDKIQLPSTRVVKSFCEAVNYVEENC